MPSAIVSGSGGLIGSEAVEHFAQAGFDVIGLENDMRGRLFGPEASTLPSTVRLSRTLGDSFRSLEIDIRDAAAVDRVVASVRSSLKLVVHTAEQASHDRAASDRHTRFATHATGALYTGAR